MIKRIISGLLVIWVAICSVLLIRWRKEEGFQSIKPLKATESYILHESEAVPRDQLTQFLVTKENIVLFYDYPGILNVYSLNGTFLYGLQVQTLQNGRGDIAHNGKYLYVHSRGHKVYVFEESELVQSFFQEDDPVMFNKINRLMDSEVNHSLDDITYYYNSATNKIEKAGENQPVETVIDLPQKNPNVSFAVYMLLLTGISLGYMTGLFPQFDKRE